MLSWTRIYINRQDRTKDSGKMNGSGRLGKTQVRMPNTETLTVGVRPYYIPGVRWCFTPSQPVQLYRGDHTRRIFTCSCHCACVTKCKCERCSAIRSRIHDLETSASDAFKMITGEFNYCSLKASTMS